MKNLPVNNLQTTQVHFGMKFGPEVLETLTSKKDFLEVKTFDAFLSLRARTDDYTLDNLSICEPIAGYSKEGHFSFTIFKNNDSLTLRNKDNLRVDFENRILSYEQRPLTQLKKTIDFLWSKVFLKRANRIEKRNAKINEEKALMKVEQDHYESVKSDTKDRLIESFQYIDFE